MAMALLWSIYCSEKNDWKLEWLFILPHSTAGGFLSKKNNLKTARMRYASQREEIIKHLDYGSYEVDNQSI